MTLALVHDVSRLPVIDATPFFDRRWGLERTVKEVRKRCRFRGPVRIIIPPRGPGGAYREIRFDGRKYGQLVYSEWEPRRSPARKKKASGSRLKAAARRVELETRRLNAQTRRLEKATARLKAETRRPKKKAPSRKARPSPFSWRGWPQLGA